MGSHGSKDETLTTTTHTYHAETHPVKSALYTKQSSMNDSTRRVSFSTDANIPAHSLEKRKSFEIAAKKVVDVFYSRILQDPLLAPFFEGIEMQTLKKKQEILMNMSFGGIEDIEGDFPDLGRLHEKLIREKGLNMKHFDQFIGIFRNTMDDLDIPEFKKQNVNETFQKARESFKARMIDAK